MSQFDPKATWDHIAGLPDEEEPNYLMEMATSQTSVAGLMGAVTVGALVSFSSLGLAAVPLVMYAAAQGVAALFIPSSPVFQESVNRRKREERREAVREHLLGKIRSAPPVRQDWWEDGSRPPEDPYKDYRETYRQMQDRLDSLRSIARSKGTSLTAREIERLDEATVDYLRLLYSLINLRERLQKGQDRKIENQIQDLDTQIGMVVSEVDRKKLQGLRDKLAKSLDNRARLPAKEAATEAQLTLMAETFEEVYHRITSNPAGSGVSEYLEEAAQRLSVEEELSLAVEEEMDELTRFRERQKARVAHIRN